MDYEIKKKELVAQFNQNNNQIQQVQQAIQQLTATNQQIVGKLQLINELNPPPIKENLPVRQAGVKKAKNNGKMADKNKEK